MFDSGGREDVTDEAEQAVAIRAPKAHLPDASETPFHAREEISDIVGRVTTHRARLALGQIWRKGVGWHLLGRCAHA